MYLEAVLPSGTSTCCYDNISHGGQENFSTLYLNNEILRGYETNPCVGVTKVSTAQLESVGLPLSVPVFKECSD